MSKRNEVRRAFFDETMQITYSLRSVLSHVCEGAAAGVNGVQRQKRRAGSHQGVSGRVLPACGVRAREYGRRGVRVKIGL